jgi:AbrB family looped-hinge helix DNA binding protein
VYRIVRREEDWAVVRVGRKHQVVVPREARDALGIGAGDEPVVEVENGKVMMKPKPRNYSKYMLGLHKNVWKGVKTESYVRTEREAWKKEISSKS